jgi:hypothetical protein
MGNVSWATRMPVLREVGSVASSCRGPEPWGADFARHVAACTAFCAARTQRGRAMAVVAALRILSFKSHDADTHAFQTRVIHSRH